MRNSKLLPVSFSGSIHYIFITIFQSLIHNRCLLIDTGMSNWIIDKLIKKDTTLSIEELKLSMQSSS